MKKNQKKKTNKRNKVYAGPKIPAMPSYFETLSECLKWTKRSVYLIVRGRKVKVGDKEQYKWISLGTGFLAAQNRFITAAHVVNDEKSGIFSSHIDGDKYYLLRHDDDDNFHYHICMPTLGKDMFIYPEVDLAIFYLNDSFYEKDGVIFTSKKNYLKISTDFLSIGTEVGVLGYPLSSLTFKDMDINKPLIGDVLLRVDRGVINCRYKESEKLFKYEFTLAFNPGNSGGPIFDVKTGKVVSIVGGFRTTKS